MKRTHNKSHFDVLRLEDMYDQYYDNGLNEEPTRFMVLQAEPINRKPVCSLYAEGDEDWWFLCEILYEDYGKVEIGLDGKYYEPAPTPRETHPRYETDADTCD